MDWVDQFLPNGCYFAGVGLDGAATLAEPGAPDPLGRFRQELHRVSLLSCVGITTLSGESPKSVALARMTTDIARLQGPAEQLCAIEELLLEGSRLFPDQHAHLIAQIIHGMLCTDTLKLDNQALPAVGRQVLNAGLRVGPELLSGGLVSDTASHDLMKFYCNLLADHRVFGFGNIRPRLEEVGYLEAGAEIRYRRQFDGSPEAMAHWLRNRISGISLGQVTPDELSPLLTYLAMLPEHLRGRVLTMVINIFWNISRLPENHSLMLEISRMVDDLPPKIRLTPLEALHNQMSVVPHEVARRHLPILRMSVLSMAATDDFRVERSRHDLTGALNARHEQLKTGNLLRGETLDGFHSRLSRSDALDHGAVPRRR